MQRQITDLIAKLQQRHHMSVLFISHDLGLVGEISNQVVVMRHGEIREAGDVNTIFNAPKDAYTRALIACRPSLDTRPKRLPVIDDIINNKPVVTEQRATKPLIGAPLIEVKGLRKEYQLKTGLFSRKMVEAVKHADFTLHKGRTLAWWASPARARPQWA